MPGRHFRAPFTGLDYFDLYRELDCSARLYEYNACFRRVEHPAVTPDAARAQRDRHRDHDPYAGGQAGGRASQDDEQLARHHDEVGGRDRRGAEGRDVARGEHGLGVGSGQVRRTAGTVGDLGAPTMFMPRMNVQSLYIEKMGSQNGIYAIYDWPDTVEAYFRALEESHDRLIDVINASPVDIINYGENVHAGTLSPKLFRKYHLPACQRRSEKLHAAGKFVCSHWDGDVKALLPYVHETGLDGIEAITPYPQGDVTLEETKEALGDEIFLLDGIPADLLRRDVQRGDAGRVHARAHRPLRAQTRAGDLRRDLVDRAIWSAFASSGRSSTRTTRNSMLEARSWILEARC